MSAGAFESAKYQADDNKVFPCKIQPETLALTLATIANSEPTAAITSGLPSIKISANRREYGVVPRRITIKLTADGTGAYAEYKAGTTHTVAIMQKSVFDGYTKGATGTYLGIACELVGKSNEIIN